MVKARKIAAKGGRVAGSGVGGFLTGIFTSPAGLGFVGIAVVLGLVFIFRDNISKAIGGFGSAIGSGDVNIGFPEFKFPEIKFPEIKFPEIKLPDITFPDFNITLPSLPELPQLPEPFVDPERMDVPFPDPDRDLPPIDIVPEFGRVDPRRPTPDPEPEPTVIFRDAERFARDFPETFKPIEIPFAVANVEETQAGFQERAAAFVKALPEVTAFTSLPDSRTDFIRSQISRNQEDFQSILEAEARRSETIFAGLFGNVQNPNF